MKNYSYSNDELMEMGFDVEHTEKEKERISRIIKEKGFFPFPNKIPSKTEKLEFRGVKIWKRTTYLDNKFIEVVRCKGNRFCTLEEAKAFIVLANTSC